MLYKFILNYVDIFSFLNVFKYLTVRTGLAMFTSMAVVFLIGMPFINFFSARQITNPIGEDGPDEHIIKKIGTPTMGGVLILKENSQIFDLIKNNINNNDYLMIKGSNSTGLFSLVNSLKKGNMYAL